MTQTPPVLALHELQPNQQADCFVLLSKKERGLTRDGQPYYRVTFQNSRRTATAMIWHDASMFPDCDVDWSAGHFYKLRCRYLENQYGSQLELDRVREVDSEDYHQGFTPSDFVPASRFDSEEMFAELLELAEEQITEPDLQQLVITLLHRHAERISTMPASTRHHHTFRGGFLEHTLSATKNALTLARRYAEQYATVQTSVSLVVAGAILHDIGKLQELTDSPLGASYTPQGQLIGHILLGRDMIREAAGAIPDFDAELLLRLEHIIVSHQGAIEHGSPLPPHSLEALIVHVADQLDTQFQMMAAALEQEPGDDAPFTSRDHPLRRPIFRGLQQDSISEK